MKTPASPGAATGVTTVTELPFIQERTRFRALLLSNPNYFGNLPKSPFKPILKIATNTTYEELGCVGFNPDLKMLEAVVWIKQPSGYGGNLCSSGSQEYVRFYTSTDGGAHWVDQGMAQFTAHNVPEGTQGIRRLEYAVTHGADLSSHYCKKNNTVLVRAILAWNDAPPPNDPDHVPVWGNRVDAYVHLKPRRLWFLDDVLKEAKLNLPPDLLSLVDPATPVTLKAPEPLPLGQLKKMYQDKGVELHRFAYQQLAQVVTNPAFAPNLSAPGGLGSLQELGPLPDNLTDLLFPQQSNTRYEELTCVGLDPNTEALVAVIRVKLPQGYSGGPCSQGSREYVTFWADFNNNGTFETCLGTTSVNVHDIANIPAGGLNYAVFLPVNLAPYRRACSQPRVVPIRAVLSWNHPVTCAHPNQIPTWGNREDTLILIPPGTSSVPGDYRPLIESVGGVPLCSINPSTGYAVGEKPFGAALVITGFVPNPPDVLTPEPQKLRYRVSVRDLDTPGSLWQSLTNPFGISVIEQTGGAIPISYGMTQSVDAEGFYTYQEDPNSTGAGWRMVQNRVLAVWSTGKPMTGRWEIKVEVKNPVTALVYDTREQLCVADGTLRKYARVRLDEYEPIPALAITGFTPPGAPPGTVPTPANDCDTLRVGATIHGTYSVMDEHFDRLSLTVEPAGPANGATVNPPSRTYPIVPTIGENGTWSLNTTGMLPCGYVVRLHVADRTIVSGDGSGWKNELFVGFCLREA